MKHFVSFVNDNVLESIETEDIRSVHEIDEATGGANKDIAALLQILNGVEDAWTSVYDARAKHRTVRELQSLLEDLHSKFASRNDDQNQWLSSNTTINAGTESGGVGTRSRKLLGLAHELAQDR